MSFLLVCSFLVSSSTAWAGTAAIDATTTYQSIRGFGASSAWHTSVFPANQATLFWDGTSTSVNAGVTSANGIGLSLLRCHIPYDNPTTGTTVTDTGELPVMQQAQGMGCTQIWACEWSPPAAFKSNGDVNNGGTLNVGSYGAFAQYLANYVKACQTNGVTLLGVSPFNEPELTTTYESCTMTGATLHNFIAQMGATFTAQGLIGQTHIIMPEVTRIDDVPSFTDPTMTDAATLPYVWGVDSHFYYYNPALVVLYGNLKGRDYWESEVYDQQTATSPDPSMGSALVECGFIHNAMANASMNAFHYWWLVSFGNDNGALIQNDGTVSKRLWVLGNWSRFVRPGYYRMGATAVPSAGVTVTAYKNNSSSSPATFVIVAVNGNNSTVSQTFTLNGLMTSSVVPWVTDPTRSLVQLAPVAVAGNSFTYNMPVSSVVSFLGVSSIPTPTNTPTSTRTHTPTNTPTKTTTATPTQSPTNSATKTGTPTSSNTSTQTATLTSTNTIANTATSTASPTSTRTPSASSTASPTSSSTATATRTATSTSSLTASPTQTNTVTPTGTNTLVNTATPTASWTSTYTPVNTLTATFTSTDSNTPTRTFTHTVTASSTDTPVNTSTFSPTPTATATRTNSPTSTATNTPVYTGTFTSTATFTNSPVNTATATSSATFTNTPVNTSTSTLTLTATGTRTNSPTSTLTPTYSDTFTKTFTPTATNTLVNTVTFTFTTTSTLTPTTTATGTNSSTSTATPSYTNTNTKTSTLTATNTPVNTNTFTATPTSTGTFTSTTTRTPTQTSMLTPTLTLTSSFTSTPVGNKGVIIYPNPVTGPTVNVLPPPFPGTAEVRVEIFTPSFRKVQDENFPDVPAGVAVQVELKDRWGKPLADGLYYLVVVVNGNRSIGKLLVLR